jgi:Mg2+ and Co2+ transporter CorA
LTHVYGSSPRLGALFQTLIQVDNQKNTAVCAFFFRQLFEPLFIMQQSQQQQPQQPQAGRPFGNAGPAVLTQPPFPPEAHGGFSAPHGCHFPPVPPYNHFPPAFPHNYLPTWASAYIGHLNAVISSMTATSRQQQRAVDAKADQIRQQRKQILDQAEQLRQQADLIDALTKKFAEFDRKHQMMTQQSVKSAHASFERAKKLENRLAALLASPSCRTVSKRKPTTDGNSSNAPAAKK